jgi:hypothetical protein
MLEEVVPLNTMEEACVVGVEIGAKASPLNHLLVPAVAMLDAVDDPAEPLSVIFTMALFPKEVVVA